MTSHKRLSNPYRLEENNAQILKLGYGVAIGAGTNTNRFVSCRKSYRRNFIVSVTRQFYARELDPEKKADTEKALLEDLRLICNDFFKNTEVASVDVKTDVISDSGIFSIYADQDNYLGISATLQVEFFENV